MAGLTAHPDDSRRVDPMDLIDRLEPEMVSLFEQAPPVDLSNLASARERSRQTAELARSLPPRERVRRTDHVVPGFEGDPDIRVREYFSAAPAEGPLPTLLWAHGGGFVMGFVETDEPAMEDIVESVGCTVFSIEWRWAPEHPYPASMHDCLAAALWLHAEAEHLGVDPDRIAIGGKSSGAGIAAGLALALRDQDAFQPCLQLLVYPMLDDRNITPSSLDTTDPRLWNRDANLLAWQAYLGELAGTDKVPAYAAPSRTKDMAGLAPTFLIVGELDLFRDEDIDYAQRLLQAGVATELHVYPGAIHGFDNRLPSSSNARRFAQDRDHALLRAFGPR